MANVSSKSLSEMQGDQVLRLAFSDSDMTLQTSGFLDGKVGHRLQTTTLSPTVDLNIYMDEVQVDSCTLNSTVTVIVPNTIKLLVGQAVLLDVGTAGIPFATTIQSIDNDTQITLTASATVSGTFNVHFANVIKKIQLAYSDSSHSLLLDAARVF